MGECPECGSVLDRREGPIGVSFQCLSHDCLQTFAPDEVSMTTHNTEQRNDAVMREAGWRVAVHNDYRLNGEDHTFWLFTHPNGRWVKGEGRTDDDALAECVAAISQPPASSPLEGVREALRRIERVANRFDNGKIPLVATDLRASLQVILAALSTEAGSGEVRLVEGNVAKHLWALGHIKDTLPSYMGDHPKAQHYQGLHAAMDAAMFAIQSAAIAEAGKPAGEEGEP